MKINDGNADMIGRDLEIKKEHLFSLLQKAGKIALAFSGGVDSTFLLQSAHEVLGDNVIALTARSPLHPAWEIESCTGLRQVLHCQVLLYWFLHGHPRHQAGIG